MPDSSVGGVETGLEAGTGGTTDGLAGEVVDQMRALLGEAVEIGRQAQLGAVDTSGIEALLICEKDDDVGA